MAYRTTQLAGALVLALAAQPAFAQEPGADNPLVSRFEGAAMRAYQDRDFDEIALPAASIPHEDYGSRGLGSEAAGDAVLPLEGRITWITYRAPEGKSTLEILRNYESALSEDDFETLFVCTGSNECGHIGRYTRNALFPDGYWSDLYIGDRPGYVVSGASRALLSRRDDERGRAHVFLYLQDDERPIIHQVVVEGEAMATGQVQTGVRSAEELHDALETEGRAVVEGVFFALDSAEVLPESAEALEQMATLMRDAPDMQVYIVGHTDNQGGLDYNRDLSARRAEAVRRALAEDHGVDVGRMTAHGVASLAPVASNAAEDGRALNRRVEMVLQ